MNSAALNTSKKIPAAYARKLQTAAQMADAAWLSGGLDAMQAELASLRRLDADATIIAEFQRIYHCQCLRVLPAQ